MITGDAAVAAVICHLVGDYCLQNHWMAVTKTRSWAAAALHVALYCVPFLLWLRPSPAAFAVVAATHLVIDRFRLAGYWTAFWGVGCEGAVVAWLRRLRYDLRRDVRAYARWEADVVRWADHDGPPVPWSVIRNRPATPPPLPDTPVPAPPAAMAVWLPVLVDNTVHLAINHLSLGYL